LEIIKGESKKLPPLKIGNLEIKVPIIQGGMGIGISLSGLASAVALCGGVGVISSANIGFMESDFRGNTLEANVRALKRNIADALEKSKGAGGAIGVNIMCALNNYEEYVKASIEAGVHMIISGAGLPMGLPGICEGTKTKLIPIVSSARATGLIFKTWAKRYNRLPDAVVFEGPSAGGHLGYKAEDIPKATDDFYETIKEIKREIEMHDKDIPLIVAGGIYTREDIDKVMECGANGVQISTRFVTTVECDADPKYKEAYINAKEEDIVIVKSPVGMPGRAIKNKFVERTMEGRIPPKFCNDCIITCKAATTPYCITQALIHAAKGDLEEGLIFCGTNAYREDRIRTVKEIMDELTQ
jgi:NAD(P)H-dependent flavin oxidoreductase YrpB (nitropropane dioxygenase family)